MIRPFGLAILAVALLLLLAVEWSLPDAGGTPRRQPSIPKAEADLTAINKIARWSNTILARPLLTPDRHPAQQVEMSTSITLPHLSAIIAIGDTRCAIFARNGEKPQLVAVGGEIDGYRVKTVSTDSVKLLGTGGLITLHLQFAPLTSIVPIDQ